MYTPRTPIRQIPRVSRFERLRFFNKLPVFNGPEYSDSPRLHHIKGFVINRLPRFFVQLHSRRVPGYVLVLEAVELELPPLSTHSCSLSISPRAWA